MEKIKFIDSHTEGEPTRVILDGFPEFSSLDPVVVRQELRDKFDDFRRKVILEPRCSEIVIGALHLPPFDESEVASVVFFNNVGVLNMCGHGLIGFAHTLRHLGVVDLGKHKVRTPVGVVEIEILEEGSVAFENVPSYLYLKDVKLDVPEIGDVVGDVIWGGNWFFIQKVAWDSLKFSDLDRLLDVTIKIREELERQGITGKDGGEIDHIELSAHSPNGEHRGKNFVLCPGVEYDRSPCGTGTSAKLASLADEGYLGEGETWVQESIIGTIFFGSYRREKGEVIPRIQGKAWITAIGELTFADDDPMKNGVVVQ